MPQIVFLKSLRFKHRERKKKTMRATGGNNGAVVAVEMFSLQSLIGLTSQG